jgi:hypothetical protein
MAPFFTLALYFRKLHDQIYKSGRRKFETYYILAELK